MFKKDLLVYLHATLAMKAYMLAEKIQIKIGIFTVCTKTHWQAPGKCLKPACVLRKLQQKKGAKNIFALERSIIEELMD